MKIRALSRSKKDLRNCVHSTASVYFKIQISVVRFVVLQSIFMLFVCLKFFQLSEPHMEQPNQEQVLLPCQWCDQNKSWDRSFLLSWLVLLPFTDWLWLCLSPVNWMNHRNTHYTSKFSIHLCDSYMAEMYFIQMFTFISVFSRCAEDSFT